MQPMRLDTDSASAVHLHRLRQAPPPATDAANAPAAQPLQGRHEPAYHPQLSALSPTAAPQCAPGGVGPGELSAVAGGQQAQEFDVVLSQLATAVYEGRPAPPAGWSAVTDADLAAAGIDDPAAWRAQYLDGGDQLVAQHFKAEVYRDCNGNFVLAYRGTDGSGADWMNNFRQGAGFTTSDQIDKFSGLATRTAVEFERRFGTMDADGNATNLAITGHSQGGGLASVAALASGVPAVTFDASGIHPNTLDRMGIDPQAARDMAEGGMIRRYSLGDDLLTNVQEGSPIALAAPDALGTQIVVKAEGVQDLTLVPRGLALETGLPTPVAIGLGAGLEALDRLNVPVLGDVAGLVRGAVSHSPELLTEAMIQQQPWEPGYRNPPQGAGATLVDMVPDALQDDFARNTHDLAGDIIDVVDTDFASGNGVQGGFRIAGDVAEGVFNSSGDTLRHGAESLARRIDDRFDGPVSDVAADVVATGGRAVEAVVDFGGNVVEKAADLLGGAAQTVRNWFR
ncbi:Mbeg1-like protein [Luteimonas sp. MJ204]|uniref:lipase family protein n=1 Tax=Luteimonas sp. MJ145 TaxID=3129234 RepID=UPI0031BA4E97